MFGFASVLEEEPLGFVARAGGDGAVVLRVPADAIRPVLERPEAVRFVARTLAAGMRLLAGSGVASRRPTPADRPAGELVRAPAVVCAPETTRARRRARGWSRRARRASSSSSATGSGSSPTATSARACSPRARGRTRRSSAVMTAPAWTLAADRSGTEALMEMLDHGIRHLPVLDAARGLVGVLDDVDLMASERRAPFRLRALVARARTPSTRSPRRRASCRRR